LATAISGSAVNATHLAAGAVTATAIAAQAITATAIAASAVNATHLSANSITATALAAGSITASALAALSITATAIKGGSITASALAVDSITATAIKAGSIGATELTAGSVTATAIASKSITATAIAAQAITATALAALSVTASAIGAQSITATAIAAQSITATAIAAQAITATAIKAGSITASSGIIADISADVITSGQLDGALIEAGSIFADRIMIGQGQSVIPDPLFLSVPMQAARKANSLPLNIWSKNASGNLEAMMPSSGNQYFRPLGVVQSSSTLASWIPVQPGQRWSFDATVTYSGSGDIRFTGRNADGSATVTLSPSTATFGAGTSSPHLETTVPSGCYWLFPEIKFVGNSTVATVVAGSMRMAQMITGDLMVNGAIDGQTITGSTITTTATTNQIAAQLGSNTTWDPYSSVSRAGLGFTKNGSGLTNAGIYSVKGTDIIMTQGNTNLMGSAREASVKLGDTDGLVELAGTTGDFTTFGHLNLQSSNDIVDVLGVQVNIGGNNGVALTGSFNDPTIQGKAFGYLAYVEAQSTQTGIPNATVWGPAQPAFNSRSTAAFIGMCHWSANDTMMFDKKGIYTIAWTVSISGAAATGRSFASLNMGYTTQPIARNSFTTGEDTCTVSTTIAINAGETMTFNYYQTSGGTRTMLHNIRITRVLDI
jgi:hypothetical protein